LHDDFTVLLHFFFRPL